MPVAVSLPPDLAAALEARLDRAEPRTLAAATESLSRRYRRGSAGAPVARSEADVLAYAAYRLPATFAAAAAALAEVREQRPGWAPRTLLDLGSGPGAAAWAAAATWPGLERVTALEAVPQMTALARALAEEAAHPALRRVEHVAADVTAAVPFPPHDLVVLSYTAGEVAPQRLEALAARAWEATLGVLVAVEPGTPRGYATVLAVRSALLAADAQTTGPCPHDLPCPMGGGDWCHFAVRLPRSGSHRAAKRAELGHEDEKYSWVALSRGAGGGRAEARILRHPQVRGGHVRLELCTRDGLRSAVVARRQGELYRRARKADWGDAFPGLGGARSELEAGPPTAAG